MPPELQPRRTISTLVVGLCLGLVLATLVGYAHVSGRLAPIYHTLGLHSLANMAAEHGSPSTAGAGHAGHSGMNMPGMDMSSGAGSEPSAVTGHAVVTITPEKQQLIGVRSGRVEKGRLLMAIRAVGVIEPDQTRLARVQTRISGWITKMYVNFIGQKVKKGDPLLEIYSPDLLATQQEFLNALDAGQKPLADAARRRLELWGVPLDEIKDLEKTKKARETLVLRADIDGQVLERNALEGTRVEPATELYRIADLSVVWLQAKVYEFELPHVEVGQPVVITLQSRPEIEVRAKVDFVEPVVQEATRTVNVRAVLNNPKDEYRPGMYADLRIEHDMGEGLLVPESALMRTGERTLAFRALPAGRFEPVEVKVDGRFGERVQVLAGLQAGDEVVTSAGFLIDSESRLKSSLGAMSGHQHGAPAKPAEPLREHPHGSPPPPTNDAGGHEHHHHPDGKGPP
jgi:Cu(I)/Ag(I) efflux system membrane fusion protein